MKNEHNGYESTVTQIPPTLVEEFLSFFRALISLGGGLFLIPVWYFLFNPASMGVMIAWEACAAIVSAIAICIYIFWEKKGAAPFLLPYTALGCVNFLAFVYFASFVVSAPLGIWIFHFLILISMWAVTRLAKDLLYKYR